MEHLNADIDDDFSYSRNNDQDKFLNKSKFGTKGQNSVNRIITTSNDDYNTAPMVKSHNRHAGTASATEFRASRIGGRNQSPLNKNNVTAAYGGESRTNFTN